MLSYACDLLANAQSLPRENAGLQMSPQHSEQPHQTQWALWQNPDLDRDNKQQGSPYMSGGMGMGMPGIPGGMPGVPSSSGQQGVCHWMTLSGVCSCFFCDCP